MLFNSQTFILLFLPVVLAVWFALRDHKARQWAVIFLSLAFYGWGDIRFLPLLVSSILFNWGAAHLIARKGWRFAVWAGVAGNLGLIGYFKYRNFFMENLMLFMGQDYAPLPLVLPIGISFFTFQQISYLVDLHRAQAPLYNFRDYAFYVSYFPQLIAGPIVRHNELIPQIEKPPMRGGAAERMGRGLVLFVMGLVKKFAFADRLAPHANEVFAAAKEGAVTTSDAWTGTLSFTFQIYFDFSAYSDMAIGIALMMGLFLPFNFDSPYKSASVRDFWRRWHMTLSRFLRDYLYIPLGGSRYGLRVQTWAQLVTMALCGLWHGAGWTFLLWGLWHAAGLFVCSLWARLKRPLPHLLGWALTFLFVVAGWVLFRAETLPAVARVWSALVGLGGQAVAPAEEGVNAKIALLGAALCLFLPNSQKVALEKWRPYGIVAGGLAVALIAVILEIGKGQPVEFIYFEF